MFIQMVQSPEILHVLGDHSLKTQETEFDEPNRIIRKT